MVVSIILRNFAHKTNGMQEIIDFLKSCQAYFIATTDGDQPRVRPFTSLCPFEGKLYIESSHLKPFAHQVVKNPKVEICAFDGVSRWIRIECELVDDPRVEAKKALLDYMPEIRELGYDEHNEGMAVYWMKDAVATWYSYTDEPRVVRF